MSIGDDDSGFQAFKRAAIAFHYNARKLTPEDRARLREIAEQLLPRSRSVENPGIVSPDPQGTDTPTLICPDCGSQAPRDGDETWCRACPHLFA